MNDTKIVEFNNDARQHLLVGVTTLANAVKVTLGPRGNNVVIEQAGGPPLVTKDGVTVAKSINLKDRFANLGAQIVKEAASRACEVAGDGTTTATVLTHAIFSEGLKLMSSGHSSLDMRRGISDGFDMVLSEIASMGKEVSTDEDIENVGTVSANGEREIGRLLTQAIRLVGREGIVTVEEAKGYSTTLSVTEGAEIDRGYVSPYFVTDHDKLVCEMKDPFVLVTNKKISSMKEIVSLLENVLGAGRPLLIVADEVEGEALQGLVMNKAKGIINVCVIKAPEFGESRVPALEDLATLLGCDVFIGGDTDLATLDVGKLGQCKKVQVNRTSTVIVQPAGDRQKVESRIAVLRESLQDPTLDDHRVAVIKRRIARLSGAVAVIRVGGATELEVKERRDRVDDALHATKAAIESGVLPGGGTSLAQATKALRRLERTRNESYRAGVEVVRKACLAPIRQILENAGIEATGPIVSKVTNSQLGMGYDAYSLELCNLYEKGIIDPVKVIASSVEHSVSAGLLLLSVGATIVEDPTSSKEDSE
jgi:chaperonin GroEL